MLLFSGKDKNALFQEKKLPDIDIVTHTSALCKLLEDKVTNQFMYKNVFQEKSYLILIL